MSCLKGILLLLVILPMWTAHGRADTNDRQPLVIIPGFLGSNLRHTGTNDEVWPPRWSSVPALAQTLAKLEYQPSSRYDALEPNGIVTDKGALFEWVFGSYDGLLRFLEDMGYVRDLSYFLFDYDWRQSNFDTARALDQFVQMHIAPGRRFDVIAHSMGGLVALIYAHQYQSARYIDNIITLGTPHWGSSKALRTALLGPNDLYNNPLLRPIMSAIVSRSDLNRTMLSTGYP